jgi:small subunit ribosomal protein S17
MAQGSFGGRKVREGTVVSDKMDKTVVVAVENRVRHPLYKKIVRRLHRHLAHDETNDAKLGDVVRIVESRPYSRRKRWRLTEVLIRVDRPEVAAQDIDLELLGEVKPEEEPGEEVEVAAAPPEAVAEEAAPEGETEVSAEAAEEVPPVEQVVTAPEAEVEAPAEEAPETVAEAPEVKAEETAEAAPEESQAIVDEAAEAATEKPEGEDKEGSS